MAHATRGRQYKTCTNVTGFDLSEVSLRGVADDEAISAENKDYFALLTMTL
jgi:hypothetical protein